MATRQLDILDEALRSWKDSAQQEEALSASARTTLFNDVRAAGDGSEAAFVPGLTRAWRWAFLGSVPVVAMAFVLMVAGDQRPAATGQLSASKVNGRLVFTLANGRADHMIYRSTDPQSFDRTAAMKMARNQYSENATGGPNLVFYRID